MPPVPAKRKPLPPLAEPPALVLPVPALTTEIVNSPLHDFDSLEAREERFLHPTFWSVSIKGNPTRRVGDLRVTVYQRRETGVKAARWGFAAHGPDGQQHYGKRTFLDPDDAKRDAFVWLCEQEVAYV